MKKITIASILAEMDWFRFANYKMNDTPTPMVPAMAVNK
jgi:hypothetical protein